MKIERGTCDECGDQSRRVIVVGDVRDNKQPTEESTVKVCAACLDVAASMLANSDV